MAITRIRLGQVSEDGTAATKDVPESGDAAAGEVVLGDDSRLADARTPSSHTHPVSELTQSSATANQAIVWNGSAWAAGETIAYTPGTSGDWDSPAPATVSEALDRLAALAKVLNSGTGA